MKRSKKDHNNERHFLLFMDVIFWSCNRINCHMFPCFLNCIDFFVNVFERKSRNSTLVLGSVQRGVQEPTVVVVAAIQMGQSVTMTIAALLCQPRLSGRVAEQKPLLCESLQKKKKQLKAHQLWKTRFSGLMKPRLNCLASAPCVMSRGNHLRDMQWRPLCSWEPSMQQKFVVAFPKSVPQLHTLGFAGSSFYSMAQFLLRFTSSAVRDHIDRCVF